MENKEVVNIFSKIMPLANCEICYIHKPGTYTRVDCVTYSNGLCALEKVKAGEIQQAINSLGYLSPEEAKGLTKEYETRINDLKNNRLTYCAYCGAEFPIDSDKTPEAVSEHILTCEKHPIYNLRKEFEAKIREAKRLAFEDGYTKGQQHSIGTDTRLVEEAKKLERERIINEVKKVGQDIDENGKGTDDPTKVIETVYYIGKSRLEALSDKGGG